MPPKRAAATGGRGRGRTASATAITVGVVHTAVVPAEPETPARRTGRNDVVVDAINNAVDPNTVHSEAVFERRSESQSAFDAIARELGVGNELPESQQGDIRLLFPLSLT